MGPVRDSSQLLGYVAFHIHILFIVLVNGIIIYLITVNNDRCSLSARVALLTYYGYHFVIARDHVRDGRHWKWFSQNFMTFHWARRFLQLKAVVMDKNRLRDEKQCLFAAFPHGINSDFRILLDGMWFDLFPHLEIKTLAASVLFRIPVLREIALWTGCVDASRAVAVRQLRKGKSVFVLPGGQAEQVLTLRGQERVYLRRRKGFIKLAIQHQVPVVPVYVFGCSDGYHTSHWLLGLRQWLVQRLGISWTVAVGYGASPFCPLPTSPNTVVIGQPLRFSKVSDPKAITDSELNAAHEEFCRALVHLYEENKTKYGYYDRVLEIL